jgi:putative flippase GtrA
LVRFALVGATATLIQYLVLIVLVRLLAVAPAAASALGFVISAGFNYLLNYRFTFRSQRRHGPALAKFVALAGVGLGLNSLTVQVLVSLGWHYLLAQIVATAVVFLWNFVGNNLWTFGAEPAGP